MEPKINKCSAAFNYEASKTTYYKLIADRILNKRNKLLHLTRDYFELLVSELIICETAAKDGVPCQSLCSLIHKCNTELELYRCDGRICLIKRRKDSDSPIIEYLRVEDSFDVFFKLHLSRNHCGRDIMRKLVRDKYVICAKYVDIFTKSCNACIRTSRKQNCVKKNSKSELKIIGKKTKSKKAADENKRNTYTKPFREKKYLVEICSMQAMCDGDFKYIFFCKDLDTAYLFIRPLMSVCAKEVAVELLSIIMSFGSPRFTILTCFNNQSFFWKVVNVLRTFGSNHHVMVKYYKNDKFTKMINKVQQDLIMWMTHSGGNNWGIGCHIVQWNVNNKNLDNVSSVQGGIQRTPYFNTFGCFHNTYKIDHSSESDGDNEEYIGEANKIVNENLKEEDITEVDQTSDHESLKFIEADISEIDQNSDQGSVNTNSIIEDISEVDQNSDNESGSIKFIGEDISKVDQNSDNESGNINFIKVDVSEGDQISYDEDLNHKEDHNKDYTKGDIDENDQYCDDENVNKKDNIKMQKVDEDPLTYPTVSES